MTSDFIEDFTGGVTGEATCFGTYPNALWGPHENPWSSAATTNPNANNFEYGRDGTAAYLAMVAPGACGVNFAGLVSSMYLGNDDYNVFPETPWASAVHPRCRVRFKVEDTGVASLFDGVVSQTFSLGGSGARYTVVEFQFNNSALVVNVSGENDGGNAALPAPTPGAYYTAEVLWSDVGIEVRIWADESVSRPGTADLIVTPAVPAPVISYDPTFGPEFTWACELNPGGATETERGKVSLDYVYIQDPDTGGGGGGGDSIGSGGGDSHPSSGDDGSGSDQNPNGFLSSMSFYEAFTE